MNSSWSSAAKISLIYIAVGTLWILASDTALTYFYDSEEVIGQLQTVKGWFYVLFTGGLLFGLIQRQLKTTEESEERWRFALEGAGAGVWDWNLQTNQVIYSKRWKEMLGYAEDEIGTELNEWSSRVHPEDLPHAMYDLQPHLDGQTATYINEHRMRCKDGSYKWILDRGRVITHDAAGKPVRVVGVHLDITDQKLAEDSLITSEDRFRTVSKLSNDILWEWHIDEGIVNWFGSIDKQLCYEENEIPRNMEGWKMIIHPEDLDRVEKSLNISLEEHVPWYEEYRVVTKGGEIQYWVDRGEVRTEIDGRSLVMTGAITDITERKQAESTLQQSQSAIQKKLKVILEPDGEIDTLNLSDIIDAEALRSLMDDFYHLTGMLGAVLDIKGNILVAVGWQDICTKFHRCHPETKKNCIESDTVLTHGVEQGAFKAYRCKNNMWDMVSPIIIGGKHLGNVFIGQFFYQDEEPDVELFREQAKNYGFDERIYLAALDRVPRFTRDEVAKGMHFYAKLADIISASSFSAIKQSRLLAEREKSEGKLKLAASVFTHARESIAITDAAGAIIDVNDTFTVATGYSREEALGQNPRILKSGRQPPEFYADMWKALLEEGCWYGEVWNRRKNGEVYAEMKTISAVCDADKNITHYIGMGTDITQMKSHQDQLERIAHYDILTNLPNRSLLSDRLSQAMLQCRRRKQSLAVVFLDLDHFKDVNDAHGHEVGDELLIALSARMKEALREGDSLARFGGDEFVAVLADLINVEDCEPVLERLLLAASEPVTVGDQVLNVSASLGVTFYPQDSVDADQLLRHADQAMYAAKQAGKNRYHLFDTAQNDAINVQRENLEAIRSALDNHQFLLHYQPKVNMRTGVVMGVEALIRWQHPERGLLNPIDFLPVIEHSPMMIEMGEWVIDTALTQIRQWQEMGLNLPVSTSVNIAAVQLQQYDFTDRLITLLAAHPDVEPHYLGLEVLETSALEDVDHVSTIMNACMALGVQFSLDDFGTGYSSLTYLRRLPASQIKIDQSFVRDMLHDADDFAIVEGVIALAKSFKRGVIAEGVETIEHGTALLQLGCELAQGYGIARPMPAGDIPEWVANWKPDDAWHSGIVSL